MNALLHHPPRRLRRPLLRLCLAAAMLTFPMARARAQTWFPLDPSPPGSSAEVKYVQDNSPEVDSFFDVFIHGFWVTPRQGPDGRTYQQIEVPGLTSLYQVGAPSLPVVRIPVAVPTEAQTMVLTLYQEDGPLTFPGMLPWPQPIPEQDHGGGTPEQFVRDEAIYSGPQVPFPAGGGLPATPVSDMLPGIPGAP